MRFYLPGNSNFDLGVGSGVKIGTGHKLSQGESEYSLRFKARIESHKILV